MVSCNANSTQHRRSIARSFHRSFVSVHPGSSVRAPFSSRESVSGCGPCWLCMRGSLRFLCSAFRTARNDVVEDNVHAHMFATNYHPWVSSQRYNAPAGSTRSCEQSKQAMPRKAKREWRHQDTECSWHERGNLKTLVISYDRRKERGVQWRRCSVEEGYHA